MQRVSGVGLVSQPAPAYGPCRTAIPKVVQMSKPTVIKAGHLCKACGSWIPFEFHGTYCPLRTQQETAMQTMTDEAQRLGLYETTAQETHPWVECSNCGADYECPGCGRKQATSNVDENTD